MHDDFYRRRTEHGHLALCCGSGATGSAIIVTVAASALCAGVKCIVKHFKNGG